MSVSRLGFAQRLYLLSAVIAALLLGLAGYSFRELGRLDVLAQGIKDSRVAQLERMSDLELQVTRVSLQVRHAILARNPEELKQTLDYIDDKFKTIQHTMEIYEKGLKTDKGRELFKPIPVALKAFETIGGENIKLITGGQKEMAFAFLVDQTIPARNALLTQLKGNVDYQEEALRGDIAAIQGLSNELLVLLLAMAAVTIAMLMGATWSVSRALRLRASYAAAAANRVRDGDLSVTLEDAAKDELSPLLLAMGDMQSALARIVSTVRSNAEGVSTASAEISQGNNDLSGRTEQQASALEQTAASMEELGSTVRHNADSAKQASQLATKASRVAIAGGEVVSQVVDTMKGINASSRKISDIIGVIDGIAFQTNILALNAAVEAARAGEQGRGFAVVASEVRSLAQRSAEAAKEIKSLISASVERVEHGTLLVDRAGATMVEVVDSIQRVTEIVAEISSASQEQSMGVSQVGEAVTQMDQATQQNAALVEQSAAAASSLKAQAQSLVQAVAVFHLSGTDHGKALVALGAPAQKRLGGIA